MRMCTDKLKFRSCFIKEESDDCDLRVYMWEHLRAFPILELIGDMALPCSCCISVSLMKIKQFLPHLRQGCTDGNVSLVFRLSAHHTEIPPRLLEGLLERVFNVPRRSGTNMRLWFYLIDQHPAS